MSHMRRSHVANIRMSHVAHINVSCGTYKLTMAHKQCTHVSHTHTRVGSHTWISHVSTHTYTHVADELGASCLYHTDGWVMSHIWMRHILALTYRWMSHDRIRMSHVTHINESRNTNEWVMSHRWMSNVTHTHTLHTHTHLYLHPYIYRYIYTYISYPNPSLHPTCWPLQDIVLLLVVCARINRSFILPDRLHCPHGCNTIARLLGNIRPPLDLPFVCHAP